MRKLVGPCCPCHGSCRPASCQAGGQAARLPWLYRSLHTPHLLHTGQAASQPSLHHPPASLSLGCKPPHRPSDVPPIDIALPSFLPTSAPPQPPLRGPGPRLRSQGTDVDSRAGSLDSSRAAQRPALVAWTRCFPGSLLCLQYIWRVRTGELRGCWREEGDRLAVRGARPGTPGASSGAATAGTWRPR